MAVKKLFQVLILVTLASAAQAQTKQDTTKAKPQVYTVSGDLQTFQVLLDALEKSDAPHNQVKALENWIAQQLQAQIQKQQPINNAPKK